MNTHFNKNHVVEFEKYLRCNLRYSKNTIKNYTHHLVKFFDYIKKDSERIFETDVDDYIELLVVSGKSFSTQNGFISALILYMKRFHPKRRFINKLERPKSKNRIPEILSRDEINMLIDSYSNTKHKAIIAFIYYHGLRRSECINFKINHFDKSNGVIRIVQSKGRKDRNIGLNDKCRLILSEYFMRFNPNEYLFNGQNTQQYSASSMSNVLKQGLERCGIRKHITLHSLRHSMACHLYGQGVQLSHIQKILGHKNQKTTEIYARVPVQFMSKIQVA